jgi:uncharacterized protein YecE (DUF72 family)
MSGKIYIGTSGWSYKHWKETFYPPKLKSTDWFDYYASFFNCSEINTSFYHLPKPKTVETWASKAPEGFLFCPKLSRYITHMKKLRDCKEPLLKFFEVFAPLQHLMGPVLIQLPPMLHFHAHVAEEFFHELLFYKENDFVLEVRHESWLQKEAIALLKKYKIGFVISQSDNVFPYAEFVTSKHIYIRFHGPGALYASGYNVEMLHAYAIKIKSWIKQRKKVWAFFNNDVHTHAIYDAQKLRSFIEQKKPVH